MLYTSKKSSKMIVNVFFVMMVCTTIIHTAVTQEMTFAEDMYYDCCRAGEKTLEVGDPADANKCLQLFSNALTGKGIESSNIENPELCGLVGAVCCNRQVRENNCKTADTPETATADPFQDTADGGYSVKLECTAACNVGSESNDSITAPYDESTDAVRGLGTQAARTYKGCLENTGTKETNADYMDELNNCCSQGAELAKEKGQCGTEVPRFMKDFVTTKVDKETCNKAALACCNTQGRSLKCTEGGKQISNGEMCNHNVTTALDGTKAECCECCRIGQLVRAANKPAVTPYGLKDGKPGKGFGLQCSTIFRVCYNETTSDTSGKEGGTISLDSFRKLLVYLVKKLANFFNIKD